MKNFDEMLPSDFTDYINNLNRALAFIDAAYQIVDSDIPSHRAASLAKTKLDEARMWLLELRAKN